MWFNNLILQKVYKHIQKQFICVLLSRSKKMSYWPTSHRDKVWYLRLSTNHRSYIWSFLTNSFSLMTIIFLFNLKFNWEIKELKSILRIMSFYDNGMWKSNTWPIATIIPPNKVICQSFKHVLDEPLKDGSGMWPEIHHKEAADITGTCKIPVKWCCSKIKTQLANKSLKASVIYGSNLPSTSWRKSMKVKVTGGLKD